MAALTSVQKKGRINGLDPVQDARVVDQFMDDVIKFIKDVAFDVDEVISNPIFTEDKVTIERRIDEDVTVEDEQTCLQRDPIIESGVTITIETGGEFFIL